MTKEELLTKWGITEVFLQKFPHAKILLEREWYDAINLAMVDSFEEIKNNFYQVFLDEDKDLEDIYEVEEL